MRKLSHTIQSCFQESFTNAKDFIGIYIGLHLFGILCFWLAHNSLHLPEYPIIRSIDILFTLILGIFFVNKKLHRWLPLAWFSVFFYSCSFFSWYLLLDNLNVIGCHLDFLIITIILLLLLDWHTFIIMSIAGFLVSYNLVVISKPIDLSLLWINGVINTPVAYINFLILFFLFRRKTKQRERENEKALKAIGGTIAHELKAPVAATTLKVQMLQNLINAGYPKETIDEQIDNTLIHLEKTKEIIEAILVRLYGIEKFSSTTGKTNAILASEGITAAIKYMEGNCQFSIKVDVKKDFTIKFNQILVVHLFINFIQNSLRSLAKKGSGEIIITIDDQHIIFRDTGVGISEKESPYIFDLLHGNNTGIGLYFCKQVMDLLGGKIKCKSEVNKYAEFTLIFS